PDFVPEETPLITLARRKNVIELPSTPYELFMPHFPRKLNESLMLVDSL
ncbi:10157_t:CDS:1, partial [Funneliformis caledonium]